MTMRFLPSEEQVMLRDSARRWVEQAYAVGGDPAAQWAEIAELGWLMIALPESAGGLGGDAYDAAIIAEEMGRGLVRLPFVEVAVTAAQVLLALAPDRVAAIASGAAMPLLAHDEPGARGDIGFVETRAEKADDAWQLTGHKTGVIGGTLADTFFVSARTPDGAIGLFEIAATEAPLLAFTAIDDRLAGELRLDETPAKRISSGDALPAITAAIDHALIVESADAIGAMQAVLDLTRGYLLTRKQYGARIGDFQALRHRLADMFIELEQARSLVLRGLSALASNDPDERRRLALATRARAAQAGHFVGTQGIQLHGGIGMTEEYPVGHYYKRLLAFSLRHGTEAALVERFAELSAKTQSG